MGSLSNNSKKTPDVSNKVGGLNAVVTEIRAHTVKIRLRL